MNITKLGSARKNQEAALLCSLVGFVCVFFSFMTNKWIPDGALAGA